MKKRPSKNLGEPLLLDESGLAHRYSVSRRKIAEWKAQGWLPYLALSARNHRFPIAECDRLILAHRVERGAR